MPSPAAVKLYRAIATHATTLPKPPALPPQMFGRIGIIGNTRTMDGIRADEATGTIGRILDVCADGDVEIERGSSSLFVTSRRVGLVNPRDGRISWITRSLAHREKV